MRDSRSHFLLREFARYAGADDAGNIFGSCAVTEFLRAAVNERRKASAALFVENANAFGAAKTMRGHREIAGIDRLHVNRHPTGRVSCIHEKRCAELRGGF